MQDIDLLVNAGTVIPVDPPGEVLTDHAVAVDAGTVLALLPVAEAEQRFRPRQRLDRPDHALLPGFVNAHTHAAMTLLRGLADDIPLQAWLNDHIWPAEGRFVSRQFVQDGAGLAAAEMLLGGTTTFADMYFFPEAVAEVVTELGMRACLGMILIEFPSAWAANADEYLKRGLELHDRYLDHPLITTAFAPHAPYTVSDQNLDRIRTLADELDVPVHMHVHETADEVAQAVAEHGRRPLERLDRLGLITPALMAVHATQLTDGEIALLAERGSTVVHCPRSNMKLANGACPVQGLADAGVNLALGTDGAASNNRLDMLGELQTAALLAKHAAGDPAVLCAAQALHMATLGGARALGLAERIGSITPGKSADLVCLDLGAVSLAPGLNPLSDIVYAADRSQVSDVWVAGRHLVAGGQLLSADAAALREAAQHWRRRLQADTRRSSSHAQ